MGRSWTGSREHSRLSQVLLGAPREAFGREVRPLLRATFYEELGASPLPPSAELGAEHLLGSGRSGFSLVALCLSFPGEEPLGDRHVQYCLDGIQAFRASGHRVDLYLLIHSRDRQERGFRDAVEAALGELVEAGCAGRSELWNRQKIVKNGFNGMLRHTLAMLREKNLSAAPFHALTEETSPLGQVPAQILTLRLNQHQLEEILLVAPPQVTDVAAAILDRSDGNLGLLIGEFGLGKTTAVARAVCHDPAHLVYVAGARIGKEDVKGAKDFFFHCFDEDELFGAFPVEEHPTFRLLARPVIEYILKGETDLPLSIVVDGIDESGLLSRRGGFQHLFNMFQAIRVPTIFTMRSELWVEGKDGFAAAAGKVAAHRERRQRRVRLVELLPWEDEQIRWLLQQERESFPEAAGRERLAELDRLIGGSEFEDLFGDIPRRPLFLRLLLDTVAEKGLPRLRLGRARLLHDWARGKVQRDIDAPIRAGGEGRDPLGSPDESAASAVDLAWEAMVGAAAAMVEKVEETLDLALLPDCAVEDVLRFSPGLQGIEPQNLAFHSLLLLVGRETLGAPRRFRFAHRAFQEFFLAWHSIVEARKGLLGLPLPSAVAEWARRIAEEIPECRPRGSSGTSSAARQVAKASGAVPPADVEIEIRTVVREGWMHLDFVVHSPVLDFHRYRIEGKAIRGRPGEFQAQLLRKLEQLGAGLDASDEPLLFAEIERKLAGIGRDLYRELFPPEMRRVYRRLRKRDLTLFLLTDEPWIPWELVRPYDASDPKEVIDDDFLCCELPMTRWFSEGPEAPAEIQVRKLAWLGGSELPHAEKERDLVRGLAHPGIVDASPAEATVTALEALLAEGGTDLLHFTGHGDSASVQPNESSLAFSDRPFRPEDLHGPLATQIGRDRPLVFLNACRVAQQGWQLTGLGGWAERWVRVCGCGAFVGPLWAVNDRLAYEFARAFYGALERGEMLGRAGLVARRAVRERYPGVPTWLAYTIYGHVKGRLLLDSLERVVGPKRKDA